jgi:hypothetical protein
MAVTVTVLRDEWSVDTMTDQPGAGVAVAVAVATPGLASASVPLPREQLRVARRRLDPDGDDVKADIQVSGLRDWFRFRYEQPGPAQVLEFSVLDALSTAGARAIFEQCDPERRARVELSAEVVATGRAAHLVGWACETAPVDSADPGETCDCIARQLPATMAIDLRPPPGFPAMNVEYSGEVSVGL